MRPISVMFAILSELLLAAHFLHVGNAAVAIVCTMLPLLLFVRRPWATRLVQATLLTGALLWFWTMVELAEVFEEMGRPAHRMMLILTGVAAFNVLSAALLQSRLTDSTETVQGPEGLACDP